MSSRSKAHTLRLSQAMRLPMPSSIQSQIQATLRNCPALSASTKRTWKNHGFGMSCMRLETSKTPLKIYTQASFMVVFISFFMVRSLLICEIKWRTARKPRNHAITRFLMMYAANWIPKARSQADFWPFGQSQSQRDQSRPRPTFAFGRQIEQKRHTFDQSDTIRSSRGEVRCFSLRFCPAKVY